MLYSQHPLDEGLCFSNQQVIDSGALHQEPRTAVGHGGLCPRMWILSLPFSPSERIVNVCKSEA